MTPTLTGPPLLLLVALNMAYFSVSVFIVFLISGWFRSKWSWFFEWSAHLLKLSSPEFHKLRDRLERFINSFYPCLAFALATHVSFTIMPQLNTVIEAIERPAFYWYVGMTFVSHLFVGTGIWMIVSMWIAIFLAFRQPLNLELSRRINRDFRPLAVWALKVSLICFAYLTLSIVMQSPVFNPVSILWGTNFLMIIVGLMILLGVFAFLLPFYNIHRTVVKLKQQELEVIEDESNKLMGELTETLAQYPAGDSKDNISLINSRLNILHIRKGSVAEAGEWPIDMNILSILSGIVLIPIFTEIIIKFLFSQMV
jgi:sensor histidine kinase YesM